MMLLSSSRKFLKSSKPFFITNIANINYIASITNIANNIANNNSHNSHHNCYNNYNNQIRKFTTKRGSLQGLVVLDLSRILAGPYCTQLLGDNGADIIKIEQPKKGDETRRWGPPFLNGESSYFLSINRNKKSVAVDLQSEEGKKIIYDLVKHADVVVENFLTGKADELGVGYATLSAINPRIVYCSITGFGATGPFAKKPGYDLICTAMYGMMYITGPEGPCNETIAVRSAVAMADVSTGLMAHGAILAALYERSQSGLGQHVDTSLMETQLSCLIPNASNYLTGGVETENRYGSGNSTIAPYQVFYCSDGLGLAVGVGSDKQFSLFCEATGLAHLLEGENKAKYQTNASRVTHRTILLPIIQDQMKTKPRAEWEDIFTRQQNALTEAEGSPVTSFPFGPLRKVSEALHCEQATARNMILPISNHAKIPGTINLVGHPVKYSRTPCTSPTETQAPPVLGQHTTEVLSSLCGYSSEKIDELRKANVIQ